MTSPSLTRAELLLYKANLVVHLSARLRLKLEGTRYQLDRQLLSYAVDAMFLLESAGKATGKSNPEERACIDTADEAYERLAAEYRSFIIRLHHPGLGWGAKEGRYLDKIAAKKEPSVEWIDEMIDERHPAVVADIAITLIEQIRRKLEDRLRLYLEEDLRELAVLRKENAALKQALNELKPGFKLPKQK